MIIEKVIGVLLLFFSYKLFNFGLNYKDETDSSYLTNIRSIGAAIIMFILSAVLIFSSEKIF